MKDLLERVLEFRIGERACCGQFPVEAVDLALFFLYLLI